MESKHIFISFASANINEAARIVDLLESNEFKCFICYRDLIAGSEYAAQLIDNIDNSDAVVLLLSKASNESQHVLREIEYAVSKNIPIIVYPLEEVDLSKSLKYYLMTHQWLPNVKDRDQLLVNSLHHLLNSKAKPNISNTAAKESKTTKKGNNKSNNLTIMISMLAVIVILASVLIITSLARKNYDTPQVDSQKENMIKADNDDHDAEDNDTSDSENSDETYISDNNNLSESKVYKSGDWIQFGTYRQEPIIWRVININPDNTLTLISNNILCMKIFDAAEGGEYNLYQGVDYWSYENKDVDDEDILIHIRGNNDWSVSNIRTWLNSSNEIVTYKDQAPSSTAVPAGFYSSESGFLYEFTDDEVASLVSVKNISPANSFTDNNDNGHVISEDLVYLLSYEELSLLKNAGVPIYAKPTEKCISLDGSTSNYNYVKEETNVDTYYWWLRDNDGTSISKASSVYTEYEEDMVYGQEVVGVCSYGIRPAICVKADNALLIPADPGR